MKDYADSRSKTLKLRSGKIRSLWMIGCFRDLEIFLAQIGEPRKNRFILHWYLLLQFFKPVHDDVDLGTKKVRCLLFYATCSGISSRRLPA